MILVLHLRIKISDIAFCAACSLSFRERGSEIMDFQRFL